MTMSLGELYELRPYRVEWRPDLVTNWGAPTTHDKHEDACAAADEMRQQFGGQTRIISQHVVETTGLDW